MYGIGAAPIIREGLRTKPVQRNAGENVGNLVDGLAKHLESQGLADVNRIDIRPSVPSTFAEKRDVVLNPGNSFFGGPVDAANKHYAVGYNPNANADMLAHELGHVANEQGRVGQVISGLRHNPALNNALVKAALLTLPAGAIAALNPGDDDTAASMGASIALAAPTLLDEAGASINANGIMNQAGLRMGVGGHARLAGGLITYMAAPLAIGAGANFAGNMLDDDPMQTPSTIFPN